MGLVMHLSNTERLTLCIGDISQNAGKNAKISGSHISIHNYAYLQMNNIRIYLDHLYGVENMHNTLF